MSINTYIEMLERALNKAQALDVEQQHEAAADVLAAALEANWPCDGEPTADELIKTGDVAMTLRLEHDRQRRRAALLAAYLS